MVLNPIFVCTRRRRLLCCTPATARRRESFTVVERSCCTVRHQEPYRALYVCSACSAPTSVERRGVDNTPLTRERHTSIARQQLTPSFSPRRSVRNVDSKQQPGDEGSLPFVNHHPSQFFPSTTLLTQYFRSVWVSCARYRTANTVRMRCIH